MIAPTGQQYSLTRHTPFGEVRATVAQVAASLREFSIGGVDLTQPYPEDSVPPFGCGIVLVPWPNRIEDGLWSLDGQPQQLDLTEPARNNAIHGLLRNTGYDLLEQSADAVTLGAVVFPQHGYPFHLETTVRYVLVDDGIEVTHWLRNLSDRRAPVAVGTHPFLTIGNTPAEDLVLTIHASTHFEVDARLNPIREHPVDGTQYDLRAGRRLGDLELDDAFGALVPVDGVSARLTAPDGREVRLRQDENHPYVQVFTTREFPTASGPTLAVAIEPMTANANAFNTGEHLRWLEPGEKWSVGWGIQYSGTQGA